MDFRIPEYPIVVLHDESFEVYETLSKLELSYVTANMQGTDYDLNGTVVPNFNNEELKAFRRSRRHTRVWREILAANIPYVIIIEDGAIFSDRRFDRERFDTVMKENGIRGKSDGLNTSTDLLLLAEDITAYGISQHAMQTILTNDPDPYDLNSLLLGTSPGENLTVRKTSPPFFRRAPQSLHIFWVILVIAAIILAFVWVNRERPSRIDSGFRGLIPIQDFNEDG